jgi:hypothetical protein
LNRGAAGEAVELGERALTIARELGDDVLAARVVVELGRGYQALGRPADARGSAAAMSAFGDLGAGAGLAELRRELADPPPG